MRISVRKFYNTRRWLIFAAAVGGILISPFAWASVSKDEEVSEDLILNIDGIAGDMTFATSSLADVSLVRKTYGIGLQVSLPNGMGVVLERALTESLHAWTSLHYSPTTISFVREFDGQKYGAVDSDRRQQFNFLTGLDGTLFLNSRQTWGVFAGVGGGVFRELVQTKLYNRICVVKICGFDPSRTVMDVTSNDWALLAVLRLGVRVREVYYFNQKSVLAFVAQTHLGRWPKRFLESDPEGNKIDMTSEHTGTLMLESTIEF